MSNINRASVEIGVIGGGMTGLSATHFLHHSPLADQMPSHHITVFEGRNSANQGGKLAPDNLGAQFIDASGFEPITGPRGLLKNLGLQLGPVREDYDHCAFVGTLNRGLSAQQYQDAVALLRQTSRTWLQQKSWKYLDREDAVQLLWELFHAGRIDQATFEAMAYHFAIEEGLWNNHNNTTGISLLAGALNLAKGETPMGRHEVIGGLQQVAIKERDRLISMGHTWHLGTRVTKVIRRNQTSVKVVFQTPDGEEHQEIFDHVVLALAPEHYNSVQLLDFDLPLDLIEDLKAARIKKTIVQGTAPRELANINMALWNNDQPVMGIDESCTFFSHWRSAAILRHSQMQRILGRNPNILATRYWDNNNATDGIRDAYTTLPGPHQALGLLKFGLDQFFRGAFADQSMIVACQPMQMGCYTKDSALQGLMAALLLQQRLGLPTSPREFTEFSLLGRLLTDGQYESKVNHADL